MDAIIFLVHALDFLTTKEQEYSSCSSPSVIFFGFFLDFIHHYLHLYQLPSENSLTHVSDRHIICFFSLHL